MQIDELAQRRDRVRASAGALDLGPPRLVAQHEQLRRAAVVEADSDAGIHRVQDRALPLDPEELAAARAPFDDEPLRRARDEVGDDRVDGDPPARDRDARLPGRNEQRALAAAARLEIELERDGHLSDRAVGADRQHDRPRYLEVRARRRRQVRGRPAQVAQHDAVLVRERA